MQELIWDRKFKPYTVEYAKDSDKFFKDFAVAFSKVGCPTRTVVLTARWIVSDAPSSAAAHNASLWMGFA